MLTEIHLSDSLSGQGTACNQMIGDLVSKETVCCVGGKVKH